MKEKQTLTGLSEQGLKTRLEDFRRALFTLKLNAQSAHVKDYSQFKKMRKECARILTTLRQKELATHGSKQD